MFFCRYAYICLCIKKKARAISLRSIRPAAPAVCGFCRKYAFAAALLPRAGNTRSLPAFLRCKCSRRGGFRLSADAPPRRASRAFDPAFQNCFAVRAIMLRARDCLRADIGDRAPALLRSEKRLSARIGPLSPMSGKRGGAVLFFD